MLYYTSVSISLLTVIQSIDLRFFHFTSLYVRVCVHTFSVLWILVTCAVLHSQDHNQDTEHRSKVLLHTLPLQPGFPDYPSPLQTITTVLHLYGLKNVK